MKIHAIIRPGAAPIFSLDAPSLNNDHIDRGYYVVSLACEPVDKERVVPDEKEEEKEPEVTPPVTVKRDW